MRTYLRWSFTFGLNNCDQGHQAQGIITVAYCHIAEPLGMILTAAQNTEN